MRPLTRAFNFLFRTDIADKETASSAARAGSAPLGRVGKLGLRIHPDFRFWAVLVLLNALLFVRPVVLMDREEGALLPAIQLQGSSMERVWRQLFLWRGRPDVLRFNSEIVLAIALWTVLPRLRRPGLRAGFVAAYLVVFAYYLYEGASVTFFNLEPVFYSQFRMATEGFSFFLQNARVTVAFVAGTVLLIAAGRVGGPPPGAAGTA